MLPYMLALLRIPRNCVCERTGDIILYDSQLAVYKHSLDLVFYIIGDPAENELMLHAALIAFSDAVHMLLRNQVEKRGVLENLDLVLLCLDETIDDGCVLMFSFHTCRFGARCRVEGNAWRRAGLEHCVRRGTGVTNCMADILSSC